jgi:oligo-1,6-glucosidase
MTSTPTDDDSWWKEAVVYEVYPRSFNDSDGDGVGDIPGITAKADYFADLGIDVVWLCPVYDSPNADNGYDIRDYRAVHDDFGDMTDLADLRSALHDRDIRFIMDLVVNHTSDEHEWFRRSRRGDAAYREFYHWVDDDPDEPPNNWESIFGGPAWTYDDERGAWYLHLFHEKQPDLNWRTPAVREAVYEIVDWWLDWGIDGFRLDALNLLSKPAGYPDGDPGEPLLGQEHFFNGPRIHEYLGELYDETFAGRDVVTVAEMGAIGPEHVGVYTGAEGVGLDMVFQFVREDLDVGPDGEWDLTQFKRVVSEWQRTDDGWVAPCLGNHDQPRSVSWWGDEAYRRESATLLATFLLTLRGTPHVYQGEEIGMTNATFDALDEIDDPETRQRVAFAIESGDAESFADVRETVNRESRDHSRTPMQWSDAPNAGFTDSIPWLKCNANYPEVNVEAARADEESVWHYYRDLVDLRHDEDVLVYGEYDLLLPDDEQVYAYRRTLDDEAVLVVLNWSAESARFDWGGDAAEADPLVGNYDRTPANPLGREFRPYEAAVYRL